MVLQHAGYRLANVKTINVNVVHVNLSSRWCTIFISTLKAHVTHVRKQILQTTWHVIEFLVPVKLETARDQ